jgi:hypothetical protein
MSMTAQQLYAPEPYISTVLGTPGKLTRPKPEGADAGHGAAEETAKEKDH